MIRAGMPTAVAPAGTSRRTTLIAPTFAPRPTRTPPSTWAYAPSSTSSSRTGAGPSSSRLPIVTPCRSVQLAPITLSAWTKMLPKCQIFSPGPTRTDFGMLMPVKVSVNRNKSQYHFSSIRRRRPGRRRSTRRPNR